MTNPTTRHTKRPRPAVVLTIAGSDCSGGAGIQADIKTISALGGYAASVITAVTAQNTQGVQAVYPLPAETVGQQLRSVMDDLQPKAIKIGMVYNADIVQRISETLHDYRPRHVVYDPVMISTSGRRLMTPDTVEAISRMLIPCCTLITPNLAEASLLCGSDISDTGQMEEAAHALAHRYGTAVLVKGGHLIGGDMCDILYAPDEEVNCHHFQAPRIESSNLHGTGCTLSSAIATFLAQGHPLAHAVAKAKEFTRCAIVHGKSLNIGHGNGPLWHTFECFPQE